MIVLNRLTLLTLWTILVLGSSLEITNAEDEEVHSKPVKEVEDYDIISGKNRRGVSFSSDEDFEGEDSSEYFPQLRRPGKRGANPRLGYTGNAIVLNGLDKLVPGKEAGFGSGSLFDYGSQLGSSGEFQLPQSTLKLAPEGGVSLKDFYKPRGPAHHFMAHLTGSNYQPYSQFLGGRGFGRPKEIEVEEPVEEEEDDSEGGGYRDSGYRHQEYDEAPHRGYNRYKSKEHRPNIHSGHQYTLDRPATRPHPTRGSLKFQEPTNFVESKFRQGYFNQDSPKLRGSSSSVHGRFRNEEGSLRTEGNYNRGYSGKQHGGPFGGGEYREKIREHQGYSGPHFGGSFEGRPSGYEGRPSSYEGRPSGYEGRPSGYEGRPSGYEGRPGGYEGRHSGYEGRHTSSHFEGPSSPGYEGRFNPYETRPSSSYDSSEGFRTPHRPHSPPHSEHNSFRSWHGETRVPLETSRQKENEIPSGRPSGRPRGSKGAVSHSSNTIGGYGNRVTIKHEEEYQEARESSHYPTRYVQKGGGHGPYVAKRPYYSRYNYQD